MSLPINLPQRDHIKGWWELNEEAGVRADSSGNGNTLQDNNTVLFGAGVIGNAADFELDTSEYLSITDALQTGLDITGEITICAWVKMESITSTHIVVSKYDGSDNQRAYSVDVRSTGLTFILSPNGTNGTSATSIDTFDLATWYHLTATLNQTTDLMQIYINGLANGDAVSYTTDIYDNTKKFIIGASEYTEVTGFFDGLIDEVIVWNKCLTAAEVLQVKNISKYNYGGGNFIIFM